MESMIPSQSINDQISSGAITRHPENKVVTMNKVEVPTYDIGASIDFLTSIGEASARSKAAWDKVCESLTRMYEPKDYDLGI